MNVRSVGEEIGGNFFHRTLTKSVRKLNVTRFGAMIQDSSEINRNYHKLESYRPQN